MSFKILQIFKIRMNKDKIFKNAFSICFVVLHVSVGRNMKFDILN